LTSIRFVFKFNVHYKFAGGSKSKLFVLVSRNLVFCQIVMFNAVL